MQYILKRRLLHAIYEMGNGRKKIETALDYGFDTYSGFYKSFVREFGCTPAEYLRKYRVNRPYPINICQEEHVMLSHKRISEVLTFWGLRNAKITDVIFAGSGKTSDSANYVDDKYVVKYANNLGSVMKTIKICQALADAGLSAPKIIPTTSGRIYAESGERYFFLSEKMNGRPVVASHVFLDEYEPKARFIGEIVGRLDFALQKIDAAVDDVDTCAAVRDWALPALKDRLPVENDFADKYVRKLESLYKQLPRQIIHRHPNPGNIIVSDDQWGFVDFELSERNVRIYDPCYAATAILSETYKEGNEEKLEKWTSLMKEIICGYDSVVHLSPKEREAVPYLILANQFVATAWFAGKDKYKDIFDVNLKMTRWMIKNFRKLDVSNA